MREFGSEFWLAETTEITSHWWDVIGCDNRYYVSGRTALDAIIQDIKHNNVCRSAYLPSYCCDSMITPFLLYGIKVKFYSVLFNDGDLTIEYEEDHGCDIVYFMEYFGYHSPKIHELIQYESSRNKIIIQDSTHSLLQKIPFSNKADYIYASFRKWTAIPGAGIAIKMKTPFNYINRMHSLHEDYIASRKQAMNLKSYYMSNIIQDKAVFLELFRKSEDLLDKDFSNYYIDDESKVIVDSLDINFIRKKRLENAKLLYEKLVFCNDMTPLYNKISDKDCPLFVPVQISKERRNDLKMHLLEHQVYCPVHWPLTDLHNISKKDKNIYLSELSLLCDQRYNIDEIVFEVELINNYMLEGLI